MNDKTQTQTRTSLYKLEYVERKKYGERESGERGRKLKSKPKTPNFSLQVGVHGERKVWGERKFGLAED